jgi:hypothetical protein
MVIDRQGGEAVLGCTGFTLSILLGRPSAAMEGGIDRIATRDVEIGDLLRRLHQPEQLRFGIGDSCGEGERVVTGVLDGDVVWLQYPWRTSPKAGNEVAARLNSTPRKVLGYQTPSEVFTAHITESVRIDS